MLRLAATLGISALLLLVVLLPSTDIGRRGSETRVRSDVEDIEGSIGTYLPAFSLEHLDESRFELADLRGHRVLLVFERSVDW